VHPDDPSDQSRGSTTTERLWRRFPGDLPHRFPGGRHVRSVKRSIAEIFTPTALALLPRDAELYRSSPTDRSRWKKRWVALSKKS